MIEYIEMRGTLTLELTDRQGRLVQQSRQPNRIVTGGRRLVSELFAGASGSLPPTRVTHMAVGTGNTPPADTDTLLVAERPPRRGISNVDYSNITENNVARVRARLTSVFDFADANGTEPLREAGIFTAETEGVLYSRVVFDPVSKTDAFKLTLLWDIVF